FSYRPGEPLGEYALHFDHAAGTGRDDKFEIAHAAYRLRRSACFQKSSGAMVCTTCHNPHDVPRGEAAVEHYRSVCQGCHGAGLEAAIEKYRPAEGEFYFELAEAYGKSGLTDKAIAMYEQALRRKPDFRPAVQRLGVMLGRSGRLSQAAEMLQKALATAPEDT